MGNAQRLLKRAVDIAVSSTALCVGAPVFSLIAVAVKVDSKGPALFGHARMGVNGRPFRVWKFRTMTHDHGREIEITQGGDPRITRLGKFLRRSKLDELPQLWNVLRGEMSLVGPRPEVQRYVEMFSQDYEEILSVRPGITDEASILFRDEEQVLASAADAETTYVHEILPKKIELYKEYVQSASIRGDLSILARTALKVVRP